MKSNKNIHLDSVLFQRRILGSLCALLVPLCILFGLFGLDTNAPSWYLTISDTYYANSKMWMIGIIFATSIFFFSYKGYDWKDRVCSLVQAISAIGIVAFPCTGPDPLANVGLFNIPAHISFFVHRIFASILFIAFAINVTFLFTLGDNDPTKQKKIRNRIYRVCGIIIFVFMGIQALTATVLAKYIPDWLPMTLINEFFMLEAFAFAYIVKSEAIKKFNDEYKPEVITKVEYVEIEKPVEDKEPVTDSETVEKEPSTEEPKPDTPPVEEKPAEEKEPDPVIGFFQKLGIKIDNTLEKWFKKKKK